MGMRNLGKIAQRLIQFGRSIDTPAAVIEKATYRSQKTVVGTLANIAERASDLAPPGTIVIGELASMHHDIAWFQKDQHEEESSQLLTNFAG